MRKLTALEIVRELLRTYQDVACPLNAADQWIGDKPGSRMLVRPPNHPYFTGSYRQLETILRQMRDEVKAGNWMLRDKYTAIRITYITPERRQTTRVIHEHRRGHRNTKRVVVVVEPIDGNKVNPHALAAGIEWITGEFQRRRWTPWLPPEIHDEAAA